MPSASLAAGKALAVGCVGQDSEVAHAPTEQMVAWLGEYSDKYDAKDAFTISGHGALDRMFDGSGRLIHPRELAEGIRGSSAFAGKKAKLVELAVSGTGGDSPNSYANRLAMALDTKVIGCDGIAYYLSNGLYLCGKEPPRSDAVASRLLPMGFTPTTMPMFLAFCAQKDTSPDPRTLLSSQASFGLFPDEVSQLESLGKSKAGAAFRLYLYNWIARRDRDAGLSWLRTAAELGSTTARYNLAYEDFESDEPQRIGEARKAIAQLVSDDASLPDLRKFYVDGEVK
jgi:TPR repeat protein